jgi:Tfp pilus assembly protein PilN
MAKDINLLPDVTLKEEKESKQQKLVTIISMLILIVGAIGLIGAFTYFTIVQDDYNKIVLENKKTQEKILEYANTEITQRSLKTKLVTAGNVLKAAKDYKTNIEDIQSLVPDGISISDITIDKANKINMNGKANNSDSFSEYVRNILDPEKGSKKFTDIALGNVSSVKDGGLQFSISMTIIKPGVQK